MPPSSPGRAKIVSVYRDLFYIGKNQITSLQCEELLETTIKQAQRWSLVPIIQSVIRYAIKGEELKAGSTLKVLAEGEMFALVVLPLFHHHKSSGNENDAARVDLDMIETDQSIFERNMIVQQGVKPVQDGALEVARSLSTVVVDFSLPCEYIGETSGVSPCNFGGEITSENASGVNSIYGMSFFWALIVCFLVVSVGTTTFLHLCPPQQWRIWWGDQYGVAPLPFDEISIK